MTGALFDPTSVDPIVEGQGCVGAAGDTTADTMHRTPSRESGLSSPPFPTHPKKTGGVIDRKDDTNLEGPGVLFPATGDNLAVFIRKELAGIVPRTFL